MRDFDVRPPPRQLEEDEMGINISLHIIIRSATGGEYVDVMAIHASRHYLYFFEATYRD